MTYWHFDDLALAACALKRPGQPQESDFRHTPAIVVVSLLVHVILLRLFLHSF
jgi:hypothetical protein